MKTPKIFELAKKYLSPTAKERERLDFESLLAELAERGEDPDEKTLCQSREKVLARVRTARQKNSGNRIIMATAKYAASFLIVGVIYFYIQGGQSDSSYLAVKETEQGMRSTVRLADGSMVRLNENSKLTYPEAFDSHERVVTLHGEAFFDIQPDPDRPFKVLSEYSEVTVLGTSFNINTFQATEITVATGKVKIADTQTREEVYLEEGQQAILHKAAIRVDQVDPGLFISWHTRRLQFEDEPIEKVFVILERVYGVKIHIRSEKSGEPCLITGFYEEEKIETIFRGLRHLVDFEYAIDRSTKTITIDLNQCKY